MQLTQIKGTEQKRDKTKKYLKGGEKNTRKKEKKQCSGCSSDASISEILYAPNPINEFSWVALIGSNYTGLKWKRSCRAVLNRH